MNSVTASISSLSAAKPGDIIHLQELGICAGQLVDLIEPDQEDFALAMIEDLTAEVSRTLAQTMWPMVGKRIWLAMVNGQIRAEVMSA